MKVNFRNLALGTRLVVLITGCFLMGSLALWAEDQDKKEKKEEATTFKEVTVKAIKPEGKAVFLPDVQGTKINAGKKTSNLHLEELPTITNNNYRQTFVKTPGL